MSSIAFFRHWFSSGYFSVHCCINEAAKAVMQCLSVFGQTGFHQTNLRSFLASAASGINKTLANVKHTTRCTNIFVRSAALGA